MDTLDFNESTICVVVSSSESNMLTMLGPEVPAPKVLWGTEDTHESIHTCKDGSCSLVTALAILSCDSVEITTGHSPTGIDNIVCK